MKTIIFALIFFSIVISCDTGTNADTSVVAEGRINEIATSGWMYGTHVLTDSRGNIIYALRSTGHDLNDYVNKKVRISGYKVDGYPVDDGPVLVEVTTIKP